MGIFLLSKLIGGDVWMNKKRIVYYDLLSVVAIFCVLWMHCNGIVHTYANTAAWKQSLVVEVIAYWAVPIFFMLSGATLMSYRNKYTTKTYFTKRIQKTLIPLLAWSIIIFIWKYCTNRLAFEPSSFRAIINAFFASEIEPVYWFFMPLFAVYMCIPVLSLLTPPSARKILSYMLVMALITISICPLFFNLLGLTWNNALSFQLTGGYVVYVLLGYFLSTSELSKSKRLLLYTAGILAAVLRYGYTYIMSVRSGSLDRTFWGYTNITTVFLASAIFIFFKYTNWDFLYRHKWIDKLVSQVSSCTFGIYLVHMIVITYVVELTGVGVSRFLWRTVGAVGVFIISFIITFLLKQIPLIKKIVP